MKNIILQPTILIICGYIFNLVKALIDTLYQSINKATNKTNKKIIFVK